MCGIAGILYKDGRPPAQQLLTAMADALAHRGPDDSGTWSEKNLGFAHRRLSIIDLEAGAQPMANRRGTVCITYNGEIYNFPELRSQLEGRGHHFTTRSDTEVIIHAWEEWGEACVEHLRGMFAFAIADLEAQRLFLARDHLGIKPLYWVDTPQLFAFASELQGLQVIPELELELDLGAIDQYLRLQYIPAPRTAYRGVHKLRPGHRLGFDLGTAPGDPERYWRLVFAPDRSRSEQEWLELLGHTLSESVRAHLIADVPFGAFLSGGVDSSAVVAEMAQILDQPVRTFCIGFEEEAFSEISFAEQASRRWQTDHQVEVLRPDALAILPTLVQHYGEPFGDVSAIPTYYVSRLAAASVPMVLSGDGGDELFAGYNTYRSWARWLAYDGTPAWKRLAYPLAHRLNPHRYPPRRPTVESWLSFMQYLSMPARRNLWRPEHQHLCEQPFELFEEEGEHAATYHPVSFAQSLDFNSYLPFAILTKVDVASMISSLEVRTPLVDREVAEVAATIPPELNFGRNPAGDFEGKLLLKRLLARVYPKDFLHRPKMGFGVPIQTWFGPSGSLHQAVGERLLGKQSPLNELFAPAAIRRLLADNASGPLWLLLFLDEWLQQQRTLATTGQG